MATLAKIKTKTIAVDLKKLIRESVLSAREKEMWISYIPRFTAVQRRKLAEIFLNAKKKLEEENKKLISLTKKYIAKIKEFKTKKLREIRNKIESRSKKDEEKQTANLLKNL